MKIKRLLDNAIVPTRGSKYAAGYDLYLAGDRHLIIPPHETVLAHTGWAMELPRVFFGAIYARSGLATKEGIRPANCVGVIDQDYRGEVMVPLHNDTDEFKIVHVGDRIAQLVIQRYYTDDFEEADTLSETSRGEGGFGSTDLK